MAYLFLLSEEYKIEKQKDPEQAIINK